MNQPEDTARAACPAELEIMVLRETARTMQVGDREVVWCREYTWQLATPPLRP